MSSCEQKLEAHPTASWSLSTWKAIDVVRCKPRLLPGINYCCTVANKAECSCWRQYGAGPGQPDGSEPEDDRKNELVSLPLLLHTVRARRVSTRPEPALSHVPRVCQQLTSARECAKNGLPCVNIVICVARARSVHEFECCYIAACIAIGQWLANFANETANSKHTSKHTR